MAAPIPFVHPIAEFGITVLVGVKLLSGRGIRIEIIVYVNGVHVITLGDVVYHLADEVAVLLIGRVEESLSVELHEPVRLFLRCVRRRKHIFRRGGYTIRIQPSMELHPALVCLFDRKSHRVPHRRRSLSSFACEPSRPRLKVRLIKGIRRRPHLEYDGIAPGIDELVELVNDVLLGLGGRFVLPLRLSYDMKPRPAEFPLGIRLDCRGICRKRNERSYY